MLARGGAGDGVPAARPSDEGDPTVKRAVARDGDVDGDGVRDGVLDGVIAPELKVSVAGESPAAEGAGVSFVDGGSAGRAATGEAADVGKTIIGSRSNSGSCSTGSARKAAWEEGGVGPERTMRKVTPYPIEEAAERADRGDTGGVGGSGSRVLRRVASRLNTVVSALDPRNFLNSPTPIPTNAAGDQGDGEGGGGECPRGTVELHMVSFGAPRVGNTIYAARYDDVVPHSFRVVVDGDPVPVRSGVRALFLFSSRRYFFRGFGCRTLKKRRGHVRGAPLKRGGHVLTETVTSIRSYLCR